MLTEKYCEIIEKISRDEDVLDLEKECENLEKNIGENPANVLYSDKQETVISYRQKVLEMENDKDDFLFSLSGHKGETMESLGRKTVVELMSFAERLSEEFERKNRQNG